MWKKNIFNINRSDVQEVRLIYSILSFFRFYRISEMNLFENLNWKFNFYNRDKRNGVFFSLLPLTCIRNNARRLISCNLYVIENCFRSVATASLINFLIKLSWLFLNFLFKLNTFWKISKRNRFILLSNDTMKFCWVLTARWQYRGH